MSIQSEITKLQNTKTELRNAIMRKGVTVYESDLFSTYPTRISEITSTAGDKDALLTEILERTITSIEIPYGTTKIDECLFRYCTQMTTVVIPSTVTLIRYMAFEHCTALEGITIYAVTPPELEGYSFSDTNDCPIYVPADSVDAYKAAWYAYADRIYAIPSIALRFTPTDTSASVIELSCADLETEGTLTSTDVANLNISGTSGSVEIGECVTSIGSSAFNGYTALTSVNISEGVTTIGNYAFYGCSSLETCTIPSTVTTIGAYAFVNNGTPIIYLNATTPPSISDGTGQYIGNFVNLEGGTSIDLSKIYTIIVPADSLDTYLSNADWNSQQNYSYIWENGAPYWILVSQHCEYDENETKTGNIVQVGLDVNPTSSTYNTTQSFTSENTETCPIGTVPDYIKVTSLSDLTDGTYLIVDDTSSRAMNGSLSNISVRRNYVDVTIDNNRITGSSTLDASAFTFNYVEGFGWTIKNQAGKYIGTTSDTTTASVVMSDEPIANSIDSNLAITCPFNGTGTASLVYYASGMPMFYYTGTTGTALRPVSLYKREV